MVGETPGTFRRCYSPCCRNKLEEASAGLGAGMWTTFQRITLPLVAPGTARGAVLAFIIYMDDLVITYFISGIDFTKPSVFIYCMIQRGIKPGINAIATLLFAPLLIAGAGLYLRNK